MLFEKSKKNTFSLLNQFPKLLLSVIFITVATTGALAGNSKSSGSKDKSGCNNNKSAGCGNSQVQKVQVCQRVKGGKYILVKPATTALLNTYLSRGAVLAKNGFCPAEIVSSAIGDPCDFASNPTPSTPTTKNSGKTKGGGCDKNGKSGGCGGR